MLVQDAVPPHVTSVHDASGKVIVLVHDVLAQVILKLFVHGVQEVHAKNISLNGRVADQKSSAAAASGSSAVFNATDAKLLKAVLAPHPHHASKSVSVQAESLK